MAKEVAGGQSSDGGGVGGGSSRMQPISEAQLISGTGDRRRCRKKTA